MHARIDQLLSLRDGEPVAADIAAHVESCAVCTGELGRLDRTRQQLQSLPMTEPPADAWMQINARLAQRSNPLRHRMAFTAAAGVVAIAAALLVWRVADRSQPAATIAIPAPQPPVPHAPTIEHLVAQSRELDEMLEHLPMRPAVERVAMAATIDSIEQRVQWLDQQLSWAPDAGLSDAQTYQLWRERVDLMDSLVTVRYVEGGRMF
jgi:hypothetical protein